MEIEQAKKYQNLYYDIELVKFDKPRPRKTQINPQERLMPPVKTLIPTNIPTL